MEISKTCTQPTIEDEPMDIDRLFHLGMKYRDNPEVVELVKEIERRRISTNTLAEEILKKIRAARNCPLREEVRALINEAYVLIIDLKD